MRHLFHPSQRKGSAQRMLTATTLVVEALIVFFAVLVAHQLSPDARAMNWSFGLALAALLVITAGMLGRSGYAYAVGFALQIALILTGLITAPMWVLGAGLALLYTYGVVKGHQWDREKDAIDAQWYRENPGADGS